MSARRVPENANKVVRLDSFRKYPPQSSVAKLITFLSKQSVSHKTIDNATCSFSWGDHGGLTEVRIMLSAEEMQTLLFQPAEENELASAFKKTVLEPEFEQHFKYMINRSYLQTLGSLFGRFSGQLSVLEPMGEYIYSSLDLPNKLSLSLYYKDGELKLASSSFADEWSKDGLVITGKPVFKLAQDENTLLTAFAISIYNKLGQSFAVCYRQFLRDEQTNQLISIDMQNTNDEYPSVYIVFYGIEQGSESLRLIEDYKFNSVPPKEISREQILSFSLPISGFFQN